MNATQNAAAIANAAIIRGLPVAGGEVFWTGRAGEAWVSADRADAFTGLSLEGARRKAMQFNRNTALHGVVFIAIAVNHDAQQDDAE